MDAETEIRLFRELGGIGEKIDGINRRLDVLNGSVARNTADIQRNDTALNNHALTCPLKDELADLKDSVTAFHSAYAERGKMNETWIARMTPFIVPILTGIGGVAIGHFFKH